MCGGKGVVNRLRDGQKQSMTITNEGQKILKKKRAPLKLVDYMLRLPHNAVFIVS